MGFLRTSEEAEIAEQLANQSHLATNLPFKNVNKDGRFVAQKITDADRLWLPKITGGSYNIYQMLFGSVKERRSIQ